MAEDVNEPGRRTKQMVAFWASAVDAFLQDFLMMAERNDRMGCAVAAARMSQAASYMSEDFHHLANNLAHSDKEEEILNESAKAVVDMCQRHMKSIASGAGPGDVKLSLMGVPNRTLN